MEFASEGYALRPRLGKRRRSSSISSSSVAADSKRHHYAADQWSDVDMEAMRLDSPSSAASDRRSVSVSADVSRLVFCYLAKQVS